MPYQIPVLDNREQMEHEGLPRWTLMDYTLAYALNCGTNVEAENVVKLRLHHVDDAVAERVVFESERGCFFAHADSDSDRDTLVTVIQTLVAEHHPHAIPGSMLDSPSAIRSWDRLADTGDTE